MKLLEIQVECALNFREAGAFIPGEAENSDHDEELVLADMIVNESEGDSDQTVLLVM